MKKLTERYILRALTAKQRRRIETAYLNSSFANVVFRIGKHGQITRVRLAGKKGEPFLVQQNEIVSSVRNVYPMVRDYKTFLEDVEKVVVDRVNSDCYGNPRYVIHFIDYSILLRMGIDGGGIFDKYDHVCKIANKSGGRKYNNKSYGGGIVFQSYNIKEDLFHCWLDYREDQTK